MKDLDEFALAKLAREMAMNIRNYKAIFEDFGITEEDYYEISKIEHFKRCKEQFSLEWNSSASAADRSRLIMAAYTEQCAPAMARGVLDETKPFSDRIDGFKSLMKGAGIGEAKNDRGSAERFIININLGGEVETYDKSLTIDANDVAPAKIKTISPRTQE
jgi:hypothetical protein